MERLSLYKWCMLMNPGESGDRFGEVVPVISHGNPDDPRSVVNICVGGKSTFRNIFDVVLLNRQKKRVRNPYLRPRTTVSEVCRVLGIDRHADYSEAFLMRLAKTGYVERPKIRESVLGNFVVEG